MPLRILVLGAGFGGLELTSILSQTLGSDLDLVLIDKNDSFVFGFSKLDLMYSRAALSEIRHSYRNLVKPGVKFLQTTVRTIDPEVRRVQTDDGTYDADILVVGLGADIDISATPGLAEGGNEFYTIAGAEKLRTTLPRFERGAAIIGISAVPYKCPPAPSEAAMLLHDYLTTNGHRNACEISVVMPFGTPVPPSPETSKAILAAFAERGIRFVPEKSVRSLEPGKKIAVLNDGTEMPYDLFLGVPTHRVPAVVKDSGMAVNGWVPVDSKTLETRFPGVYAIGDVTSVGTPKSGTFAEEAARVVAAAIISQLGKGQRPDAYAGRGSCYVEFGGRMVGRIDADFLSGPKPTSVFHQPSHLIAAEKGEFRSTRLKKWFGK